MRLRRRAGQIVVLRFLAALGMGGEWSLGVALVMEIWPDRSRGLLAGVIGAAANVGFLLIGAIGHWLMRHLPGSAKALPASDYPKINRSLVDRPLRLAVDPVGRDPARIVDPVHSPVCSGVSRVGKEAPAAAGPGTGRRWTSGASPSAPWVYWRFFTCGRLSWRWQRLGGTVAALTLAVFGYLYPVVRYLQRLYADSGGRIQNPSYTAEAVGDPSHAVKRIPQSVLPRRTISNPSPPASKPIRRMLLGACLSGVPLLVTWASVLWTPTWANQLTKGDGTAAAKTQMCSALGRHPWHGGGALCRLPLWPPGITYFFLCVGSLAAIQFLFHANTAYGPMFLTSTFAVGLLTASFYGWLPLYLPELFPSGMRAIGQGFSYNFGRNLAAIGVLQTGFLMQNVFHNDYARTARP